MNLKILLSAAALLSIVFVALQAVPYGRAHANPAVVSEPPWDAPRTRELAQRACYACHSNETVWPWYSNVAPVSWLVQRDVDHGRAALDFSEWGRRRNEAGEAAETVAEGEMPPWFYLLLNPAARLTPSEDQALASGLQATFGARDRTWGRRD